MSLKKVILGAGILATLGFAGIFDTHDVKTNTNLGLGANPAAIAVNKKVMFEAGTVAINMNKQNAKILNGTGTREGKNENDMNFMDASRFFWYTGKIGDNWFGVRHTTVSNVYPFGTAKMEVGALQNALDPKFESKVTMFKKDTVESLSLVWAKELSKGYSAGVELASNVYTLNDNTLYNSAAEQKLIHPALAAKGIPYDSYKYSVSKPYYTLTMGLVKELNDVSKLSFAHKLSQDRGIYHNNDAGTTYVYNESLPNETALSYIYKVNNSLEIAGIYKAFWGLNYQKNVLGSNNDYSEAISKSSYNNLGFAADYKLNDKWSFQGYGNFIRNYKRMTTSGDSSKPADSTVDYGWNVTQLGANVQYWVTPTGTLLLGCYNTKLLSEDKDVGYLFDITNTYVSYSHKF